jgi:hypothetical protein
MWRWERKKFRRTDIVKNEEESRRKGTSYIQRKKANWIGHILHRNCLLRHVTAGEIDGRAEVAVSGGRRHKQLLNNVRETRKYWKLK